MDILIYIIYDLKIKKNMHRNGISFKKYEVDRFQHESQ